MPSLRYADDTCWWIYRWQQDKLAKPAMYDMCRSLVLSDRWEAERPPGAMHTSGTGRHLNALVSQSRTLRRLLDDEPAVTLRVLTDPRGRIQSGIVAFVEALLRRDMAEFGFVPIIEPNALAYALVRLG